MSRDASRAGTARENARLALLVERARPALPSPSPPPWAGLRPPRPRPAATRNASATDAGVPTLASAAVAAVAVFDVGAKPICRVLDPSRARTHISPPPSPPSPPAANASSSFVKRSSSDSRGASRGTPVPRVSPAEPSAGARVPGEKHPRARILPRRAARAPDPARVEDFEGGFEGFGAFSWSPRPARTRPWVCPVPPRGREARTPRRRRRRREGDANGRGRRRLHGRIRVRCVRERSNARASPLGARRRRRDAEDARRGHRPSDRAASRNDRDALHRVVVKIKPSSSFPRRRTGGCPRRVGAPDEHREPPRGKRRG